MRSVVQRVSQASVRVADEVTGCIEKGVVVLLGVGPEDTDEDIRYMVEKIINLRIFSDEQGKMNLSLKDVSGAMLIISQFTLYGDCRKGRRPGYSSAAAPEKAENFYQKFVLKARESGLQVETGRFQADMQVSLVNDGPVTLLLDSQKQF